MTRAEALTRAGAIPGWMTEPELAWLYDRASECEAVVEVGVFCGRSTFVLSAAVKGHVVGIDSFVGPPGIDVRTDDGRPVTDGMLEQAARKFLAEPLKSGKLVLCPESSQAWLDTTNQYRAFRSEKSPTYSLPRFDMLFIDGAHDRESVEQDLKLTRWLKPGGLLCGHDYDEEGVNQAIEHLEYQVAPDTRIFWLRWKGTE